MLQIVDELTDKYIYEAVKLSKHRNSRVVEKQDVQFLLTKLNAGIPPISDGKNPLNSQIAIENRFGGPSGKNSAMAPQHIQRLNVIEQSGQKM